jgi:hypothetical protein
MTPSGVEPRELDTLAVRDPVERTARTGIEMLDTFVVEPARSV